jgi:hypothetical protein
MNRFVSTIAIIAMLVPSGAEAANYERTYPPRIIALTEAVTSFYVEFRAREEIGGYGHSYITLGAINSIGEVRETVVAGFMPKSADDDYWSQFGLPVTGSVGVVRSDVIRRPDTRFRIAVSKPKYDRILSEINRLRRTWTTYELLVQNCNSFVGHMADAIDLRTPLLTAQYPVNYVAELRALNSR